MRERTCRVQAMLPQIGLAASRPSRRAPDTRSSGCRAATTRGSRLVRQAPLPPLPTPRVLGVDDWSFRKGRTFGTLLVDLERHQPVDLLPDREGPTLTAWLLAHPGVEIVSRDRSQTYAEAIRLGAPQALQVADRWHLLKNLGEALEGFLLHKKQALKEALPRSSDPPPCSPAPAPWTTGRTKEAEANSLRRHARFIELYHQVHALDAKQLRVTASAERLEVSRGTIYHYLQMDHPRNAPRPKTAARARSTATSPICSSAGTRAFVTPGSTGRNWWLEASSSPVLPSSGSSGLFANKLARLTNSSRQLPHHSTPQMRCDSAP
jgi:hypothetical protein